MLTEITYFDLALSGYRRAEGGASPFWYAEHAVDVKADWDDVDYYRSENTSIHHKEVISSDVDAS